MSKMPFITVQDSADAQKVELAFDDATGVVIGLSPVKGADMWWNQNMWLHWYKASVTSGNINFTNTQNDKENYGSAATPAKAPAKVTLFIKPGSIRFETSQGSSKEGTFAWLKAGTPVYLYIFSHPPTEASPAGFTLKSVKVF